MKMKIFIRSQQWPDWEMDFVARAHALGRILGHFLLSISVRPDIRDIFKAFNRKKAAWLYSASHTANLSP